VFWFLKLLNFQNKWTLWFFKNDRNRTWEENQRPIITFSTVEDFWALYNHIEQASKLNAGCDYSLFKVVFIVKRL
jgi:translation initiation factor 4E